MDVFEEKLDKMDVSVKASQEKVEARIETGQEQMEARIKTVRRPQWRLIGAPED
jgi:chaperonin cofactor prefoldin